MYIQSCTLSETSHARQRTVPESPAWFEEAPNTSMPTMGAEWPLDVVGNIVMKSNLDVPCLNPDHCRGKSVSPSVWIQQFRFHMFNRESRAPHLSSKHVLCEWTFRHRDSTPWRGAAFFAGNNLTTCNSTWATSWHLTSENHYNPLQLLRAPSRTTCCVPHEEVVVIATRH